MARITALLSLGFLTRQRLQSFRTYILRSDETGSSLVEMALCLPILLMIVTGITTFGIVLNNYIMLTNSVGVGARQLAILRGSAPDPCATVSATIASASPLLKSGSLKYTFVLNGTSHANVTTCTDGAAQLIQGKPMQVVATYPCSLSIYGKNLVPSCTLTAQTTELEQ